MPDAAEAARHGPLTVAVVADDAWAIHVEVLLRSILSWHAAGELRVCWLHDGLGEAALQAAGTFARENGLRIDWIDYRPFAERHGWPREEAHLYVRLSLPEILADSSRLLFLDADTLVCGSLWELWNTDLHGASVGAVPDFWVGTPGFFAIHDSLSRSERERYERHDYVNAGVLLFDCGRWREGELTRRCRERLEREPQALFRDQDTLNEACAGEILLLSPRWNVHPGIYSYAFRGARHPVFERRELQLACARPGIVHYAGHHKPWASHRHWWPTAYLYHRYRRRSRSPLRLGARDRLRLTWLAGLHQLQRLPRLYEFALDCVEFVRRIRRFLPLR